MIGVFRSLLFRLADDVPSRFRFVVEQLLCFLIVGIHASGISTPLSLLMLLEWSLIWIASLTLRVYRWGSRSINLTWFHKGRCPVSFACSETAEVCVWASRISLSCSFILSCIAFPVSPIYTLPIYTLQTKRGIFLYGIKSSLSIVTLTDTHVGSKRLSK